METVKITKMQSYWLVLEPMLADVKSSFSTRSSHYSDRGANPSISIVHVGSLWIEVRKFHSSVHKIRYIQARDHVDSRASATGMSEPDWVLLKVSKHIAVTHNICGHNSCTQLVLYYYDQVRPTRKKLANPRSVRKIFSCEYLVLIIQYLLPLHLSITITITDNLAVGTQLCQASLSMLCHTDTSTNKKFVSTNSLLFKI